MHIGCARSIDRSVDILYEACRTDVPGAGGRWQLPVRRELIVEVERGRQKINALFLFSVLFFTVCFSSSC